MSNSQRHHGISGVPFYLSPSGGVSGGGLRRVLFEFRSGARCVCPARASLLATRQKPRREGMSTNTGSPFFASFLWRSKERKALPGAPGLLTDISRRQANHHAPITEQIYVHSKLMIVDDRFALLGSANINDRSLLGSRDSELAVLVLDGETSREDICGDGKLRPTRRFARNLRMAVWNKLFGITAGGRQAATQLADAVKKPAAPQSWQAIQEQASANTTAYEAVFDFIPRNKDVLDNNPIPYLRKASPIWPRWHDTGKKDKDGSAIWMHTGPMPFDADFWKHPQFIASALGKLNDIKGFITRLPIEWTKDENNNLGYPTALVAKNTIQSRPVQPVTEIADNKNESSQEQQT